MNLNHPFTPPALATINQSLIDCLAAEPVDETHLKVLIEQRAKLVDILLNDMKTNTDSAASQRKAFAKAEMSVNDALIEKVSHLRNAAKLALSSVAKSSRAIKQYQKV